MSSANVVYRMIALAQTLVGHLRGGLAQVVTLFMFFAGISGSSAADVAVLSRTVAPEMDKERYDRAFTAALIASASTMANLIPPSIMAGGLRRHGLRVDRRVVPGRRRAGGDDRARVDGLQLLLRSGRHNEAAGAAHRHLRGGARLGAAAGDPAHHYGRHPNRLVHADP